MRVSLHSLVLLFLARDAKCTPLFADDRQVPLVLSEQVSYIDAIYGELVRTEDSLKYKQELIEEGAVEEVGFQFDEYEHRESYLIDRLKSVNSLESMNEVLEEVQNSRDEGHYERSFRRRSHEGYLRYQSKVNFPSDDDTSDITDGNPNLFGGILTFARLPHFDCFNPDNHQRQVDIAIVGAPFDTGTSYRPGARMAPEALRSSARRIGPGLSPVRGSVPGSNLTSLTPYDLKSHNFSIVDCGDVPMTPFDNRIALNQLYRGERAIHKFKSKTHLKTPKIITMGGDHTITLMALRSAYEKYGKLAVLHFDSHIDTWNPKVLGGGLSDYMSLNHGTFLHYAAEQGYLAKNHCSHVGLRAPYINAKYDKKHDEAHCGFKTITARDVDNFGLKEISAKLKALVGDLPVYISVDIDVLDPSVSPGTGTMEVGGLTSRELLTILEGLEGVNVIGGDVVEVSPPYDSNSEITSLAATAVIDSLLGLMLVTEI